MANDNFDSSGRPIGPGGFVPGGIPISPGNIVKPQTIYPPHQPGQKDKDQTNYPYDVYNGGRK